MNLSRGHDVVIGAALLQQWTDLFLQTRKQVTPCLDLPLPQQRLLLENLHLTEETAEVTWSILTSRGHNGVLCLLMV